MLVKLLAVHDSAMEGNPVLDRYGKATGNVMRQHAAANRALELIGKEQGMFVERVKADLNVWSEILDIVDGKSRNLPKTDDGTVH